MNPYFSSDPDAPVLVIGAAGLDVLGRLRSELHMNTSNPAQIQATFGGVARNISENLARLGHPVHLLTAVGEDEIGVRLIESLSAVGVDVSSAIRLPDLPTGAYIGAINQRGELQMALDDMRAISAITPAYLRKQAQLFKEASLVFVDANLSRDALRSVFSLARRYGKLVCGDPTSTSLAPRLQPYLSQLFILTPNSAEAGLLCDMVVDPSQRQQGIEAAKCLVSKGVQIAIVTMAQFGVVYATRETRGHIEAMRTEIIDPTGAGDALTSAVIFGLLNEVPLDDALRLGISAASLTLRYQGAVRPDLSLQKLYDALVI
jgi:pseudouridine kinase